MEKNGNEKWKNEKWNEMKKWKWKMERMEKVM